LTAEDAAAARRLLLQLLRNDVRADDTPAALHELACRIGEVRKDRRHFFSDDLFADPAWDMILSLYCAEGRGERVSVTALGHSVGLAQTTAVRWINALTKAGLIERCQDDHDRRRHFVRLTDPARHKITEWLERAAARLGPLPR
jgi:DNA-binding MarR family transcriptional regulator